MQNMYFIINSQYVNNRHAKKQRVNKWELVPILKCYHYFISLYVTYFGVKIKTMQIEEKLAEGLFETENSSKINK